MDSDYDFMDYSDCGNDSYDEEEDDSDEDDYDEDDPDEDEDDFYDEDMDCFTRLSPASKHKTMKRCQSILAKLNKNRSERLFCDATISVGDKKYPVHKTVLTAASSYFYTMFTASFMEKNEECIEIRGVSEEVFGNLLDYIYGQDLKFNFENIKEHYMAADMLCIDELVEDIKLYFKENWRFADDINAVYEMVQEFDLEEIVPRIINNVRNCLSNFSLSVDYRKLSYEFMCKVLEGRFHTVSHLNRKWTPSNVGFLLNVECNTTKSLVRWAMYKPEERLPKMALELLSKLRLELIPESQFNEILEKSCNSNECAEATVQTFKQGLKSQYEKSPALIGNDNFELVALDVGGGVELCNVLVFDISKWKWDSKSYPVGFKPESALLKDDDFYVFGTGGGCILNTRTQALVKLPCFPVQRSKFTSAVVNNTVSVWGGIKKNTKRRQADVLERKPNSRSWSHHITWRMNKCNASTILINECLYIVGGVQPNSNLTNEDAAIFVYDRITNDIKKIGELYCPMIRPKLAVLDNVLYIFKRHFNVVERICLKTHTQIDTVRVKHASDRCVISDVFPVRDGIIVVFIYEKQIMLGLVKPSENMRFEILGLVPKPNSSPVMGYRKNYFIYLRKRVTL